MSAKSSDHQEVVLSEGPYTDGATAIRVRVHEDRRPPAPAKPARTPQNGSERLTGAI